MNSSLSNNLCEYICHSDFLKSHSLLKSDDSPMRILAVDTVDRVDGMDRVDALDALDGDDGVAVEEGERRAFFLLRKNFPGAEVVRLDPGREIEDASVGVFDYIVVPDGRAMCREPGILYGALTKRLKPHGILAGDVYGYCGHFGAALLSSIIGRLGGANLRGSNGRVVNFDLIEAILGELPGNHPAFDNKEFIQGLKNRDERVLNELLDISTDNIYTVSKLMAEIPRWGGLFKGWVHPGLYEADFGFIKELPEPRRSIVSELVTASPPVHYFLMGVLA
ncbi:MAG: hypothetical protein GY757_50610 [bacterium]|nr:hypothetical protein [bacterium]